MPKCEICDIFYKNLGRHIEVHGIDTLEYQRRFPNAKLAESHICSVESALQTSRTLMGHEVDSLARSRMAESKKGNENAKGSHVFDGSKNSYNFLYYDKDRERLKKRTHSYQSLNYEAVKAHHKQYLKNHPEIERAYVNNYRARKLGAEGYFTFQEWVELCEQYSSRCAYCGKGTILTADHVIPLSEGGSNYISNILPACKSCNSKKGVMNYEEFLSHNHMVDNQKHGR